MWPVSEIPGKGGEAIQSETRVPVTIQHDEKSWAEHEAQLGPDPDFAPLHFATHLYAALGRQVWA